MSTNLPADLANDAFLPDNNHEDIAYLSADDQFTMSSVLQERENSAPLISAMSLVSPKQKYYLFLSYSNAERSKVIPRTSNPIFITELPVAGYTLLKPIPVQIKQADDKVWIARFEEANIGMSGHSLEEAKEALVHDIVNALELFLEEEEKLTPKLKENLDVLKEYIEVR